MTDFNWCHGPSCHKQHTVDRVRGVKGSKVLRTKKIKIVEPLPRYYQGWENHFCKVGCLFEYVKKHIDRIVEIAPVREPSETPIEVKTEKVREYRYNWNSGQPEKVPYISTKQKIIG